MAEFQLEKNASKETIKYASKNSIVVKRPVSKTKTTKSKKIFMQILEIIDSKQSTKRKILATNKGLQKPHRNNKDRLPIKDVNLELEKPRNKKNKKENQR